MMGKLLGIVLYAVFAPFVGGFLAGLDRKVAARMQGRQGPPVLQPFYDLAKLFNKQTLIVNSVQDFLVCGYLIFVLFTGCVFFAGGDLLLIFFALTLAEIFLLLAASSANSPYSSMGAQRELMQIMTYEPMILISGVGFYLATGSFFVSDIVKTGIPSIVYMPGIFFGFLYILTIKFRKSPFDISTSHHAHQEMSKGLTQELSGGMYAFVELAAWYEDVMMLGLVALFVINLQWWSIPIAVAVALLAYFLEVLVDNIFPRVKWEKMLSSTWIVTLVAGGINLLVLTMIHH